ncbi:MAG: pyridoxal 5'-phosphate synthase glutaminase subunit PdxT [Lachnospiraceae bacterium]
MVIGVLALQGAFAEHIQMLNQLGVDAVEIRKKEDFDKDFDGLIFPGGESTVQGKLLHELDLFEDIKAAIEGGTPVFATCAGLILLAKQLDQDPTVHFGTLPVVVRRNAYGRQSGSYHMEGDFKGIGTIPMTFIRAPFVTQVFDPEVEVLAKSGSDITGVRYKNQLAISFHPELDNDLSVHKYFLQMIKDSDR